MHIVCYKCTVQWSTNQFVQDVYEKNLGSISNVGVSLVHKLTLEYTNLTSFSKMRVDLAAQVELGLLKAMSIDYYCTGSEQHCILYSVVLLK